MSEEKKPAESSRSEIIDKVKTPLGFFTLIVLIVEVVFGIIASLSSGSDRTYLIIGMILIMLVLIGIVAGLAFLRPEALSGNRPPTNADDLKKLSPAQRIAKYRDLIEQETQQNLLVNFHIPQGYTAEISSIPNLTFGFCYPKEWKFSRLPEKIQYGTVADVTQIGEGGFARNLMVVIGEISGEVGSLEQAYQGCVQFNLDSAANAQLMFQEMVIFQGLQAVRFGMTFALPSFTQVQVYSYQTLVIDARQKYLYNIVFTTTADDFEKARPIFDNIANTFRI